MEALWFSKTGVMRRDRIKSNIQLFEAVDGGYYPVHPEAVYRDMDQKRDAMIIFWQDVVCPEGGRQTRDYIESILRNIFNSKMNNEKLNISKAFLRAMNKMFGSFIRYFPIIVIAAVLLYAFVGGG